VFHFTGQWPDVPAHSATASVVPLPLLEELVWDCYYDTVARREFLGAQPTVLHAPFALISQCWSGAADAPAGFLARVCDLRITTLSDVDPLDPTDVARVLRAAPRLKKFHTDHCVHSDASWLAPTAPTHPAFEGLVHPRLQKFGVARDEDDEGNTSTEATPPHPELVAHLRRRHFPRLREVVVGDDACSVTPPPWFPLETGTTL
jgi:hypothetical protein